MPGFAGFGPSFGGTYVHHSSGGRVRRGGGAVVHHGGAMIAPYGVGGYAYHGGGMVVGHGPGLYPYGWPYYRGLRPACFYSGWFGFHDSWAQYMDWMEHDDYLVWHGWQQMLSTSTIGMSEQRNLLQGMLQQQHGGMSRQELNQLTDRILQMNKQLGAGDDGRVSEVTETTTTTTTTSSSNITQQQRYDTANDFLQLLTSSGGMGFSLEQAQQKANDIRQGKQDAFVQTHLESQAAKANVSQQAVQAPPQQMQIQAPQPAQQLMPPTPATQIQQQVMSPQPQGQAQVTHSQYTPQQVMLSPSPQVQLQPQQQLYNVQQNRQAIQPPAPQMQQSVFNPQPQTVQSTPLQLQYQNVGSVMQQSGNLQSPNALQHVNTNQGNLATTSTSTTTTTTTDGTTSAMQGMSLGLPNQSQVQSPVPHQQYAPQQAQYQIQSPAPQYQQGQLQYSQQQQQPQLTYPGFAAQQPQHVAALNHQSQFNGPVQMQTPAPTATSGQQPQSSYLTQNYYQQPQQQQQQLQQAPQQLPMQVYQQAAQPNPQQLSQQPQYVPSQNQVTVQQPTQAFSQGSQQQQGAQQPQPLLHQQGYR